MPLSRLPDLPWRSLALKVYSSRQPSSRTLLGPKAMKDSCPEPPSSQLGSREREPGGNPTTLLSCFAPLLAATAATLAAAACWEKPGLPGSLTLQQPTTLSAPGSLANNLNVKVGCSGKLTSSFPQLFLTEFQFLCSVWRWNEGLLNII